MIASKTNRINEFLFLKSESKICGKTGVTKSYLVKSQSVNILKENIRIHA